MKDKYCIFYDVKNLVIHVVNLTEVYKSPIRSDNNCFLIDVIDHIVDAMNFQEELKPEFMSERNFHKKGHLSSDARDKMQFVLLYDNEEFCFKTHLKNAGISERFSRIANFASEERCTIVGNILMDYADEKDISLQAAYMRFVEGDLWAEYKERSIELTYQELKKEAAIKPITGVIKIENPVMKYSVSIDVKFEDFVNKDCQNPDVRDVTNAVVMTEHMGYPLEGYSAKGAYYYIPNEMLKSAIVFVTKDA